MSASCFVFTNLLFWLGLSLSFTKFVGRFTRFVGLKQHSSYLTRTLNVMEHHLLYCLGELSEHQF